MDHDNLTNHSQREIDELKAQLAQATERADLLTFLQVEGLAWSDDYIRRHRSICQDKRTPYDKS